MYKRQDHPALVVAWVSSRLAQAETAAELARALDSSVVVTCATAAEMLNGKTPGPSVVALALSEQLVGPVVAQCVLHPADDVKAVLANLHAQLGGAADGLLGLVFSDGMAPENEALMTALRQHSPVDWVGWCGGDALGFCGTSVAAQGRAVTSGAVLVLMRPRVPFRILHEDGLHTTELVLTVTRTAGEGFEICELDGRPARTVYAETLGVPAHDLTLGRCFLRHPLGALENTALRARSIARVHGSHLQLLGPVRRAERVRILELGDALRLARAGLQRARTQLGGVSAILHGCGMMRWQLLAADGAAPSYGALFEGTPAAGGVGFGELYRGFHNHTALMVVFGR